MKFVIYFKMSYFILFSRPREFSRREYTHVCSTAQSCPILGNPIDCSLPDSSVHGILQARILEWVAMPFSKGYSQPRDHTHISCGSCIAGIFFTTSTTWEAPSRREIGPYFWLLLLGKRMFVRAKEEMNYMSQCSWHKSICQIIFYFDNVFIWKPSELSFMTQIAKPWVSVINWILLL